MYYILRVVAMLTMTIDHIGVTVYPDMQLLRGIGRIAYPLYVYCAVCGWDKTHDKLRYILRLCGLAVLSEPLFDIMMYTDIFNNPHIMESQNVIFGLALSVFGLAVQDRILAQTEWSYVKKGFAGVLSWGVICGVCLYGNVDYFVITPVLALLYRYWKPWAAALGYTGLMAVLCLTDNTVQMPAWMCAFGLVSVILIFFDKNEEIEIDVGFKKFWTIFYPAHLAAILMPELIATVFIITGKLHQLLTTI